MEIWGMWLVAIGVIVAGASAAFAWVQAHATVEALNDAREARDDARASAAESARIAGEANVAFNRQAEAQEEANRIKREEMAPDDWSFTTMSKTAVRATNTSKRHLIVTAITVQPESTAGFVLMNGLHEDGNYDFGESFTFNVVRTYGHRPEKLTINYRYEEDASDDWRTLHVSL